MHLVEFHQSELNAILGWNIFYYMIDAFTPINLPLILHTTPKIIQLSYFLPEFQGGFPFFFFCLGGVLPLWPLHCLCEVCYTCLEDFLNSRSGIPRTTSWDLHSNKALDGFFVGNFFETCIALKKGTCDMLISDVFFKISGNTLLLI